MEQQKTIILPPQVIAALYENVLIENADGQPKEESPRIIEKKKTVVIAESVGAALSADRKIFLDAIIKACQLQPSAVEVLTDKHPLASDYKKINEEYSPESIILFGPSPSLISLPVFFPPFQIQLFQETKYLHAPALDMIENDKNLKLQLWQCLKQLFP
ncbi:MAG: hypothetical protein ACK5AO_08755 [bacterium]